MITVEDVKAVEQVMPAPVSRQDRLGIHALVLATVISSTGNQLTAIAIPWFVYVTTGSAARTGLVAFAGLLPIVVAGLAGGLAVDRLGFKRASIVADIASGLTVAVIPTLYLLDALSYWHLLALAFLGAVLDVPGQAARTSLVPGLANRADMPLERANAAMQLAMSAASVIGPLTAGILIAAVGATSVLFIDAASFGLSAFIVAVMVVYRRTIAPTDEQHVTVRPSPLSELFGGVRFLFSNQLLATVIAISVAANFLFAPLTSVIFPVYVKETFDRASALGFLVAGFGGGSIIGTILYGAFGSRFSRYAIYACGGVAMAAGFWLLPVSQSIVVSVAAIAIIGLAIGPINAIFFVVLQERVPEALMGRVFAAMTSMTMLASPLGVLAAGFALEVLDSRWVLSAIAVGITVIAAVVILHPTMRHIDRSTDNGP